MPRKLEESIAKVNDPRELEYRVNEYGMKPTASYYGISYYSLEKAMKHHGVKLDKYKTNRRASRDLVAFLKANRQKKLK